MYNKFEPDIFNAIYPLTIVADRYGGVYSGGKFLAFNCLPNEVPEDIDKDFPYCRNFWVSRRTSYQSKIIIGKGQTVEEAVENLYRQLKKEGN